MQDSISINFKNEKEVKEALERWQVFSLIDKVKDLSEYRLLRQSVANLEKSKSAELLKDKDNPEKWLELYRAYQVLEQKSLEMGVPEQAWAKDILLFDTLVSMIVRGVLHEQLDIDPEVDGLDLNVIMESMDTPSDFFDTEIEKDEDFVKILEDCESKDILKVHNRLSQILSKCNNAYTLKRADYTVETVKMPVMGFLGKSLFPALGNAFKKVQSKTPCGIGRGDWIDTPTSFILARTNDLLQEAKGRLSVYAEDKEEEEAARIRRKRMFLKIKKFFKAS